MRSALSSDDCCHSSSANSYQPSPRSRRWASNAAKNAAKSKTGRAVTPSKVPPAPAPMTGRSLEAARRLIHLIIEALLLAAPTRKMDGDVGGNLDPLRQDLPDPAIYLLLCRGRQFQISRDGREMADVVASTHRHA